MRQGRGERPRNIECSEIIRFPLSILVISRLTCIPAQSARESVSPYPDLKKQFEAAAQLRTDSLAPRGTRARVAQLKKKNDVGR